MRILMITTEWPSAQIPHAVPFIVRQVEFLRRAGVDVDVFYFRGGKNPLNYLRAWCQVQERLTKETYDLVHAQWGQSAFPALPKRIPLVVTFRGSDLEGIVGSSGYYLLSGYFLSIFSCAVALLADQVVVVSESIISKLPKRIYHTIPSGLNFDLFRPMDGFEMRRILQWPIERKVVFFGGDPAVTIKRYSLACAAVLLLEKDFPLITLVPAHGIEHDRMPYYLNASDVMLLTSMHEGSPNVVKEALACNVPVVSTNVGDVRQRIGSIDGCVVCDDDHPETIARAIKQVLVRDKRIDGRETIRNLDENLLTHKLIAVYKMALSK